MEISDGKVVSIDYTLKNDGGEVLDTSDGRDPLSYIHGIGALIPGLESELAGKSAGDELNVTIPPENAYGVRHEELVAVVKRSQFDNNENLEVGMQFQVQQDTGTRIFTIKKIEGDEVTLDGNHPLADMTLHFSVKVLEVRDATKEELEHGHVH